MALLVLLSRNSLFCLLYCLLAFPSFSQDQAQRKESKRVWTNDDLGRLAARPVENASASPGPNSTSQGEKLEKQYFRARDVNWYASQLKPLNAELDDIDAQLRGMRQARKDGRGTTGAVSLDQEPEGITTDAQIKLLELRRTQVLKQIDDLEDQSRRNGLEPGNVRSATSQGTPNAGEVDSATAGSVQEGSGQDEPKIVDAEQAIQREMEHLKRAINEKDLLQRNATLQRRQLTSNPEYLTRHVGDFKLASAENEIKEKDDEIQLAQGRLAELQDHLEELNLNRRRTAVTKQFATTGRSTGALPPTGPKSEEDWRKEFSDMHYKIRMAQSELDVLQRELNVSLIQYDPNPAKAMRESITRRQINERRKKIDDKKADIQRLKQEESDLEDELRYAGGDPGWSRE